MTKFEPIPDPSGALEPPRRYPPTAVGAATPDPDPEWRPVPSIRRARRSPLMIALTFAVGLPLLGLKVFARTARKLAERV